MLKGKMNHKDTLGYSTTVEEGGVQIMSAGSGLRHEEYNIGDEEVNFYRSGSNPSCKNINPRYQTRSFPKSREEKPAQDHHFRRGRTGTLLDQPECQFSLDISKRGRI